MSAMFTQQAIERMRDRGISATDVAQMLKAIERLAENPSELGTSSEVVRVKWREGEEAFIVRAGDMRAVVTADPESFRQLLVLSVYRSHPSDNEDDVPLASAMHD